MNFQFEVNLTEKDYLDYNIFWNLKSPYGKKQMITLRLIFALIFGVLCLYTMWDGSFSPESILVSIPYCLALIAFQVFFNNFMAWSIKRNIKTLKKKGKMGYTPVATITFENDKIIHVSPETKQETNYSLIERISIIKGRVIYIHINNLMAHIVPLSCFVSKEHYDKFIQFIKTKCSKVKYYK